MREIITKIICVFSIIIYLDSCAVPLPEDAYYTSYKVETDINRFDNRKTVSESANYVKVDGLTEVIFFNLQIFRNLDDPTLGGNFISVSYFGEDFLSIPEGESLKFIADDQLIVLSTVKKPSKDILPNNGGVMEIAIYDLPRDTALKLAESTALVTQLYTLRFPVPKITRDRWKRFIYTHWPK